MREGPCDITPGVRMKLATFEEYSEVAENCDIALWTPSGVWGRYIARFTGGPFSHITGVVKWSEADTIYSVGYEETGGGFGKPLATEAELWPERIHIYRVRKSEWKQASDELGESKDSLQRCVCRRLCDVGHSYRWSSIWLIVRPFIPFVGLRKAGMNERVLRASAETKRGICSQHVHRSFGECGMRFSDRPYALTTPNDIADSVMTKYICTLTGEA